CSKILGFNAMLPSFWAGRVLVVNTSLSWQKFDPCGSNSSPEVGIAVAMRFAARSHCNNASTIQKICDCRDSVIAGQCSPFTNNFIYRNGRVNTDHIVNSKNTLVARVTQKFPSLEI